MSDSFVTQCPHCRTSFRVSQVQLAAAQGAVRCGACLHVFNAHQHLLENLASTPAPAPSVIAPAAAPTTFELTQQPAEESSRIPRKDPLDTVWIHDDLDLDSLDLDEELARLEQEERLQPRALLQPEPDSSLLPAAAPQPATPATTDERWAEQLLEESQGFADTPAETAEMPAEPASADSGADVDVDERHAPSCDDAAQRQDADSEQTVEDFDEDPSSVIDPAPVTAAGMRPSNNLFELSEDPLRLQWQAPSKPWGRWLAWGLLNLLAAGTLVAQYSIYHFDELARQDAYRPWFESVCPLLGCNLPPKVDVNLIKSSNLVVRSHPEFAGALVVDAILYNRATFSQPFPLLELRFSDINDKLMANRRFKPSEYLAGELAGQNEMPPQTPIHISLDILDPGQEAVNYSLTFLSPE